jgi:hypothetical protein
VVTVEYFTK